MGCKNTIIFDTNKSLKKIFYFDKKLIFNKIKKRSITQLLFGWYFFGIYLTILVPQAGFPSCPASVMMHSAPPLSTK